jgi:elongation factor P--beta-lysine ligase
MSKIFEALDNKAVEIRENAMQCLVEVGRQEYISVTHYFAKIAEVTSKAALHDEGKVGAQGIEFWTTLAEEELSRERKGAHVMNYIKNCKDDLIQLLLSGIKNVHIEDDDEDDEEWGVNMSSGCCL